MSDVATTRGLDPARPWSFVALAFSIAAMTLWVLAGIVDDGLYLLTGILGVVAFGLGLKGRREATRAGARRWPAITAMAVGGFLGGLVIAFSVAYAI